MTSTPASPAERVVRRAVRRGVKNLAAALALFGAMLGASRALADGPELLSARAWRADLAEMVETLRTVHFAPFHRTSEADFVHRVDALDAAIPDLTDREILFRMAEIVASLEDGHTRLALPRVAPELAIPLHGGHGGIAGPRIEGLRLGHLPVPVTGADFLAGRDPVLEAALQHEAPDGLAAQVEDLLRRGRTQEAVIHLKRFLLDPEQDHAVVDELSAAGHRLLDEGLLTEGFYVFTLATTFFPESSDARAGLDRARELRGEREADSEPGAGR